MRDAEREGLLIAIDTMFAEHEREIEERLVQLDHLRKRLESLENSTVATVGLREELDERDQALREALLAETTKAMKEALFNAEKSLFEGERRFLALCNSATARLAELKDGEQGPAGEPGEPGERGERGEPGERGQRGETGVGIGHDGAKGDTGDAGPPGEPGERGVQGEPGEPGAAGEPGQPGEKGDKGDTGEQGDKGDAGEQGERGVDGQPGDVGQPGERGEKGDTGDAGEPGAQGDRGEPGDAGERGEKGEPGEPGERGDAGEPGQAGAPGEPGEPGQAGAPGEPGGKGDAGERGTDGINGEPGEKGEPGEPGEKGERGERGPEGIFRAPSPWVEGVHYESELVHLDGSTYCAACDTAARPPHADWTPVALAGRTGMPRGQYDPDATYAMLDRVSHNSAEWIAKVDHPGPLPGDDWMLGAKAGRGKPGEIGKQGPPGEQGPTGATIEKVSRKDYTVTLEMTDGQKIAIDFRPMFERYRAEVGT